MRRKRGNRLYKPAKARQEGPMEKSESPVVVRMGRIAKPLRSEGEALMFERTKAMKDLEMAGKVCSASGPG